jgi:hypothetical protein
MNRTAFDHLDGVVLWVVGGGPMDRDVPTFSFERDTGCLRRIQLPNGPSGPETTLLNVATVVEQLRLLEANGDSPKAVKASLRSSVPALSIQRSNNVLSYRLNTLTKLGVVEH